MRRDFVQTDSDYPAVYVSWNDARKFMWELNRTAGSELYRLPTEAEWEYACRAGTATRWSFGDDERLLNVWNVGKEHTHKVGIKEPNPWGLYDMHGNVWEWCQDWYGEYSSDAQVNPTGPASGVDRVQRGGHSGNYARPARSAFRTSRPPSYRGIDLGFRLVRLAE